MQNGCVVVVVATFFLFRFVIVFFLLKRIIFAITINIFILYYSYTLNRIMYIKFDSNVLLWAANRSNTIWVQRTAFAFKVNWKRNEGHE